MPSKADKIMDVLIEELNNEYVKVEDIHLMDYDSWHKIEDQLKRRLRSEKLDLSYDSDFSEKYNVKLSGNADGILWSFRSFYKNSASCGWKETKVNSDKIENANNYYEEDRYGYPKKITKESFISLVASNQSGYKHMGIGSQASIIDTTVTVYADDKNNLMYSKSVLILD